MGIIVWLILSLGTFVSVYGTECLPETVMCSPHWVQMDAYKDLFESEEELNAWCRKQSLFFRCLDDVLLVKYGNYSKFPTNMLVSKMLSQDLCLEGSTSRRRYLDNAACINKLNLDYCKMPEFLDILIPDDVVPKQCAFAEKTFSCIYVMMVMRCGYEAGRVYRNLLKVTKYSDEICGVENSGIPCEELPDSERSEIVYVRRLGRILEQVTEASSLDQQESVSLSEESIIAGAIKDALDDLDSSEGDVSSETLDYSEVVRSKEEFRKRPIITEPFKGLLFYNYSNEEFEFYWRQPGSFPISRVTCEHVLQSEVKAVILECILHYRYEEPECIKSSEEEEITPELIRDIDLTIPEDSTLNIYESPDWAKYLQEYKRHRLSWEFFFNAKIVTEEEEIRQANKELEIELPNSEVCSKELRFYDIVHDHYMDWWQCPSLFSDGLRSEILTFLFQNRNRDTDAFFLTAGNYNDTGEWRTHIHIYEPLFHGFEKVVCERVNECHTRGRGVFKCALERRGIEGCDSCCVQFPFYAQMCPSKQRMEANEDDGESSEFLRTSEEGSGALEDESPTEVTAFLVNEEATNRPDFKIGTVGLSEDPIAVGVSELPDDLDQFSPLAGLMFLRRNLDEDSIVAQPEGIYISGEETLYDSQSEPELMVNNNMFILQAVPSIADLEAVYEIVESKD